MSQLFVDGNGERVVRENEVYDIMNDPGDRVITTFRKIENDGKYDELSCLYYLPVDVFNAKYKKVQWNCGVDIYAILHQTLDRARAAEFANKIEIALMLAQEKT